MNILTYIHNNYINAKYITPLTKPYAVFLIISLYSLSEIRFSDQPFNFNIPISFKRDI